MSPDSRRQKTNPNAPESSSSSSSPAQPPPSPPESAQSRQQSPQARLSPLQLAAARHFAKGGRTLAVADVLKVNRRTLSRWQRLPAFRAEIARVHLALSQPPPRPAPSAQLRPTEREFLDHVYTAAMRQFMKM